MFGGGDQKAPLSRALGSSTHRFLIIDDDPGTVQRLSTFLTAERAGDAAAATLDIERGLAALHADRPDVVLLDAGMPGFNGLEVLKRMRDAD
jgi:DNA-binding response OmpR family regulator